MKIQKKTVVLDGKEVDLLEIEINQGDVSLFLSAVVFILWAIVAKIL